MYKLIIPLLLLFMIVGCSTNSTLGGRSKKEVVRSEIKCTVDDGSFVLMLEDGQIVKYIDSVDGELEQETVDILNDEHLVGVTDNDEALRIMDSALSELGGSCSK